MTKEITKAFILQEIQDKFKLRELVPDVFAFSELVVPIYDIEQHLENWYTEVSNTSITAGAEAYKMFTVPHDEKWKVSSYNVMFIGGSYTVAGIYISRVNKEDVYSTLYLDLAAGQSVSYINVLPALLPLFPGDEIYAYVDGYTSTGVLRLIVDHQTEEIR